MVRQIIHRGLLIGILLMSLSLLAYAGPVGTPAVSRGMVLTVVAIHPQTDTATLQADDGGQQFQIPTTPSWEVGTKVECNLVDDSSGQRLQDCLHWR